MKKVQHENSATRKKHSDRAKFGKKRQRSVQYSALMDNEASINETL